MTYASPLDHYALWQAPCDTVLKKCCVRPSWQDAIGPFMAGRYGAAPQRGHVVGSRVQAGSAGRHLDEHRDLPFLVALVSLPTQGTAIVPVVRAKALGWIDRCSCPNGSVRLLLLSCGHL